MPRPSLTRSDVLVRCLLGLPLLLCTARPVEAIDQVFRKSVKTPARGEVTAVSRTAVTVKQPDGKPLAVPANDIVYIRWDTEPIKLAGARSADRAGLYDRALEGYATSQEDPKGSGAFLKVEIQFLVARARANQAFVGAAKPQVALAALETFIKTGANNFRYFDAVALLGRVYLNTGEYAKAKTQFEQLATAPFADYKLSASSALAQVLLAQDNVDGALSAFQAVIDSSRDAKGVNEVAQRHRAVLGKSTCLIRKQDKSSCESALKDLDAVLAEVSEDNEALLAESYLRRGDCLRLLNRPKESVLAYLHVDLLFASQRAMHAEALFHLGSLWAAVGHPERASAVREKLRSDYPQSSWTKRLGVAAR